ncbi:hypothetical protein T484DRAFT_1883550 [Baffinella frigidus]|nr:hypothetical protein T484DRAFT_1883550 [Cryptophyta sp. CCMP2293]
MTDAMREKRGWLDAETRLRDLLSNKRRKDPLSKRDLWYTVRDCGALEGSTAMTRARRILDTEMLLMTETAAPKIVHLLEVCGNLSGSPSMQRAQGLLETEGELAAVLQGEASATVDSLRLAIKRCDPLCESDVMAHGRAILACEDKTLDLQD